MKAITIWQPWASWLASGKKLFETRSWYTKYRGPIAIHAASRSISSVRRRVHPKELDDGKRASYGAIWEALEDADVPLGCIVGMSRLVDCYRIYADCNGEPFIRTSHGIYKPDERERSLGDWTPGRYAWGFADMKPIEPIPAKGKQGLWEWKEEQ